MNGVCCVICQCKDGQRKSSLGCSEHLAYQATSSLLDNRLMEPILHLYFLLPLIDCVGGEKNNLSSTLLVSAPCNKDRLIRKKPIEVN